MGVLLGALAHMARGKCGFGMLLVLVVVCEVVGGTHVCWLSCAVMMLLLVVGSASLRPLFYLAFFAPGRGFGNCVSVGSCM